MTSKLKLREAGLRRTLGTISTNLKAKVAETEILTIMTQLTGGLVLALLWALRSINQMPTLHDKYLLMTS